MDSVRFRKVVPVLRVAEMQTSLDFYTFTLGFTVLWRTPGDDGGENCMLQAGPVDLMLSTVAITGETPPAPGTLYFDITGVAALYEQLQGRVSIVWPLGTTSYGMREFGIRDPDGYTLAFSEEADANSPEHPHDSFLREVVNRQGPERVIQIIKEFRDHTGLGLKESKDAVEEYLKRHQAQARPAALAPDASATNTDVFLAARIALGRASGHAPDKIALIRDLREHTGLGLKETKDLVDTYCATHPEDVPTTAVPGILESLSRLFKGE